MTSTNRPSVPQNDHRDKGSETQMQKIVYCQESVYTNARTRDRYLHSQRHQEDEHEHR
jgi:hypothetical protein